MIDLETVRIIPCLDVDAGRVVKGVNFVGLRDAGDPIELAARYGQEGADEVVFLDITASSDKRRTTTELVRKAAEQLFIPFTVGGGVRTVDDARELLRLGADKVAVNSAAVDNPALITEISKEFGCQAVVVAIDAKRIEPDCAGQNSNTSGKTMSVSAQPLSTSEQSAQSPDMHLASSGFEIYIHGGRTPTGIDAVEWAKRVCELGAGEIMLTSMDADGTKAGYDLQLTKLISTSVPVPVIASGGVGNLDHLLQGVTQGCAQAVLAASIFHFGEYSIAEAKAHLAANGVQLRPV